MLLALAVAVALPTPIADAQPRPAPLSRAEKRLAAEKLRRAEFRSIPFRFGQCVVKKHYGEARAFVLATKLEDSEFRRLIDKLADGKCLMASRKWMGSAEMDFPNETMRYALVDALIQRDYPNINATSLKDSAPLEEPAFDESKFLSKLGRKVTRREADEFAKARTRQAALNYFAAFGECVVRADAVTSYDLIKSDPESELESRAFATLRPMFANCLSEGQTISFSKMNLRGTIAVNFYRLAQTVHPMPVPGAAR